MTPKPSLAASADATDAPAVTVAERMRKVRNELAPAELRVIEVLMADYPMAGTGPIGRVAEAAGVSAPTVLRLVTKLGFTGYGEFRAALQEELKARLFSPVGIFPNGGQAAGGTGALVHEAHRLFADGLATTFGNLDLEVFEAVGKLLSDPGKNVMLVGGRFSWPLASQMASLMQMLRANVVEVAPAGGPRDKAMLDVGPKTVVVVMDYRRYQASTVRWGLAAQARGATLVVMTDPFLSPLAPHTELVLTSAVSGPPPFDALTSGFAIVEALCSVIARNLGRSARARLGEFERLQHDDESDVPD
jgi:DNA-binding MurR/RpiR family transcriptional regulator